MLKKISQICFALSAVYTATSAHANDFATDPKYPAFKQKMVKQYNFKPSEVDYAMRGTKRINRILSIMSRPGESKEWYEYRPSFVNTTTINRGIRFKRQYSSALRRAEQIYGVPESVILGILGVETSFGANKGSFRSIDALATLAFGYPRRAEYFTDELAALLAWSASEKIAASSVIGSYAGAIGYSQFMPSNIPLYGVDFDNNGHVDLRGSAVDAIGSIANYLARKGWQRNRPIGFRAYYTGKNDSQVVAVDLEKPVPYGKLKRLGLKPVNRSAPIDNLDMVNGIRLMESSGPAYWVTYPNFQIITTYNRSRMYATAVWQLGEAIYNK